MSDHSFLPLRGEATRASSRGGWGSYLCGGKLSTPTRAAPNGASLASPLRGRMEK
jgi:hypothetical protein